MLSILSIKIKISENTNRISSAKTAEIINEKKILKLYVFSCHDYCKENRKKIRIYRFSPRQLIQ
jgi:hypothetical protein